MFKITFWFCCPSYSLIRWKLLLRTIFSVLSSVTFTSLGYRFIVLSTCTVKFKLILSNNFINLRTLCLQFLHYVNRMSKILSPLYNEPFISGARYFNFIRRYFSTSQSSFHTETKSSDVNLATCSVCWFSWFLNRCFAEMDSVLPYLNFFSFVVCSFNVKPLVKVYSESFVLFEKSTFFWYIN